MRRMYSKQQLAESIKDSIESGDIQLYDELDIADSLIPNNPTGISTTLGYCRIRKTNDNNIIVVLNFSIKNDTESSISIGNNYNITWSVPSDISNKIYDLSGNTVAENPTGYATKGITSGQVYSDNGTVSAGFYNGFVMTFLNVSGANLSSFQMRGYGNIAAGATHNLTFRIFLTL